MYGEVDYSVLPFLVYLFDRLVNLVACYSKRYMTFQVTLAIEILILAHNCALTLAFKIPRLWNS